MCNLYIKHFETYLFFGLIHDLTLTTTSTKANDDNQVGYEINLLATTLLPVAPFDPHGHDSITVFCL